MLQPDATTPQAKVTPLESRSSTARPGAAQAAPGRSIWSGIGNGPDRWGGQAEDVRRAEERAVGFSFSMLVVSGICWAAVLGAAWYLLEHVVWPLAHAAFTALGL